MNEDAQNRPSIFVEGRTVVTTEVIERPVAERPTHDSVEAIAEWLIGAARGLDKPHELFAPMAADAG